MATMNIKWVARILAAASIAHAKPRCDRTLEFPLYNNLSWQQYTVPITVGTPPQEFIVQIDSGSADLWVPSPDSPACNPNCPPTFNTSASSTYHNLSLPWSGSYGFTPNMTMNGTYFDDTVRVGGRYGTEIENMTLALLDVIRARAEVGNYGIMGLGPPAQESLINNPNSPAFQNASKEYPVLWERLYDSGYITHRIFSIWLNRATAKYGSILFGGTDPEKHHGEIRYSSVRGGFLDWRISLESVTFGDGDGEKVYLSNTTSPAIMDNGAPNIYLPLASAEAVARSLNATSIDALNGPFPYVNCNAGHGQYLEFTFAGNPRPRIRVEVRDVIYPFGMPENIGPVYSSGEGGKKRKLCYLGVQASQAPFVLLGATFQRSAYVVFDVDGERIGMAPARY